MALADSKERQRVLTELDDTLLVEAAAGTGKTALMAARVTMLLLRGTDPASIAAITFTELAAAELVARIHRYVDELLEGRVPEPLELVLDGGLTEQQRLALVKTSASLGQLTTATIHAFCQQLITSYAVEADIDPGARVLDADQAASAFDTVFDRWLKRRLGDQAPTDDAIAVLSRHDPKNIVSTLKELARSMLQHRGSRPPPSQLSEGLDEELVAAAREFERWLAAQPFNEIAVDLARELSDLAVHFEGKLAESATFATLWQLAHPPQLRHMTQNSKALRFPALAGPWSQALGKEEGESLASEARQRFERVNDCYAAVLGSVSAAVVERLGADLAEILVEYDTYKRSAAALDFDDLLQKARDLVSRNEAVRLALGARYRHIFVDEFQDTDPVQCEILFLIGAEDRATRWQDCRLRPGALFLVGDPKQAIYRFRGADIDCYQDASQAIRQAFPKNVVQITANFRSRASILAHVNSCFAAPLNRPGQPGYVSLMSTVKDKDEAGVSVAAVSVEVPPPANVGDLRSAEAECIAEICSRLIGNIEVRDERGTLRLLRPGDIALLAPYRTELWRYEQALEAKGLPIASQAGKNLHQRQETQDLLALARALADPSDGVAFGALLRGPLVGLTESELLDIAERLPASGNEQAFSGRFTVLTRTVDIAHPLARQVVEILQDLRRRARSTTPALLLAEAVDRLQVRPILVAREGRRSDRALANVEAFIDRARLYGVTGLKRFVREMTLEWRTEQSRAEGRVDWEGEAIELITIHSAKGLEWPVVIPINTASGVRGHPEFVHRASDKTIHWIVGDVVPPSLRSALAFDQESKGRENERLWYVACTRARDLLIVPRIEAAKARSWARVVQVVPADLAELDVEGLVTKPYTVAADACNEQTREAFEAEQQRIVASASSLTWIRPSEQDADRLAETVSVEGPTGIASDASPIGAGRVRGLILHKLVEEVLTGELTEESGALVARARELMQQLDSALVDRSTAPDAAEIARTAQRTLALPDVAALRPRLIPEVSVYGVVQQSPVTALAGRIDAIARTEAGDIDAVIDWKSDVAPSADDVRGHAAQLADYLRVVDARRGALVYMTNRSVHWISRES